MSTSATTTPSPTAQAPPAAGACNHTPNCWTPGSTWHIVRDAHGRKFECRVCGRFYGYLRPEGKAHQPTEETEQAGTEEAEQRGLFDAMEEASDDE
jgi:hypothetical protein